jgi:hypothetical protein
MMTLSVCCRGLIRCHFDERSEEKSLADVKISRLLCSLEMTWGCRFDERSEEKPLTWREDFSAALQPRNDKSDNGSK